MELEKKLHLELSLVFFLEKLFPGQAASASGLREAGTPGHWRGAAPLTPLPGSHQRMQVVELPTCTITKLGI